MDRQKHPVVAVLDTLRRDAAVLQDPRATPSVRENARVRFEANLRTLGIDYVEAQRLARAVA